MLRRQIPFVPVSTRWRSAREALAFSISCRALAARSNNESMRRSSAAMLRAFIRTERRRGGQVAQPTRQGRRGSATTLPVSADAVVGDGSANVRSVHLVGVFAPNAVRGAGARWRASPLRVRRDWPRAAPWLSREPLLSAFPPTALSTAAAPPPPRHPPHRPARCGTRSHTHAYSRCPTLQPMPRVGSQRIE